MQKYNKCYFYNSVAKEVTVHYLQQDHLNGGFLPKPDGSSYIDPTTITLRENETLILVDENTPAEKWEIIPHYMFTKLYLKTDKTVLIIEKIGQSPADFPEYTEKPVPDKKYAYYYKYSEQDQDWIFDFARYKDDALRRVSSMCVGENYKMFPQHKRDNVYSGRPVTDNYPEYLQGEAGKQSIARLNAVYQDIAITAQTAIMSEEVQTPEAVDLIIKNIKFPTEEEILLQIQG
jgi:hypothetical protein